MRVVLTAAPAKPYNPSRVGKLNFKKEILKMDPLLKWFDDAKVIAVIRASSAEDAEEMIRAASEAGIRIFEISMQTPQAIRLLETYTKKEGLLVGAGTVIDGEMAYRAIKAGAKFLSSPYSDRDILNVAKNNDVFVIQGAFTPTEAVNAHQMGADLIQIYHAGFAGGPNAMQALKGPFPFLKLVAAGGVKVEDACEYLKSCVAVAIRSDIFEKALVRSNNWTEIKERARLLVQKLEATRVTK